MHFNESPSFFTVMNSNGDGSTCLHILTRGSEEDDSSTCGRQVAVHGGEGGMLKAHGYLKRHAGGGGVRATVTAEVAR